MKNITANDVADLAGVSRWTVARAFRKNASISKKNRSKILDAARELGYVPDLLASSLASNKTNLVALLIDDFENPHKLPILKHLTEALQHAGMVAILINIGEFQTPTEALLSASQRRVDAAVLIGTGFSDELLSTALGAQKLKKLIVFARESSHEKTVSICCDNEKAVCEIVKYIHSKNYCRPVFLAGPRTLSTALKRKSTFIRELKKAGLPEPMIINIPAYNREMAMENVRTYLQAGGSENFPDLMFCENDVLAIGAMDIVKYSMGLRVPQDIAIIGFDDIDFVATPAYDITTYQQPLKAMTEKLIEILMDPDMVVENIHLAGELVVRSSA
ncbi:MAG: LacI family DNA-binding transcriptional regulator [Rhodobacteraceae bacterium]|nr:LacI family DNA-binding transcriptional regulator [Paracoccaceae bacterium]